MEKLIKQLNVKGPAITSMGHVEVWLAYTSKPYIYNNPSSHEQETKQRMINKVITFTGTECYEISDDLLTDDQVLKEINRMQNRLLKHLESVAFKKEKNFSDKLKEIGFK